jgi:hypothetical protein
LHAGRTLATRALAFRLSPREERIEVRGESSIGHSLQITSCSLFALDRFEQRFEIPFAETLRAFALNDLEK